MIFTAPWSVISFRALNILSANQAWNLNGDEADLYKAD